MSICLSVAGEHAAIGRKIGGLSNANFADASGRVGELRSGAPALAAKGAVRREGARDA